MVAVVVACLAVLQRTGDEQGMRISVFLGFGKRKQPEPEPKSKWQLCVKKAQDYGMAHAVLAFFLFLGLALLYHAYQTRKMRRRLQRPYEIRDLSSGASVVDAKNEFYKVVSFIQDSILLPIDKRLPGRPFEFDFHSFPFTPMVLVVGNHSSGKSTFINRLMGLEVQETGVAPTDDGFTVLERHKEGSIEDGPTVLGCPENRPFRELRRFGQTFSGHLRRKRLRLVETSTIPLGLQIVDTPGMIDLPASSRNSTSGRGYNFVEVVRWWAKRADLILLLFDPDKPGTTGETLDVLTKSLAGLNHKFLVVLNKVDKLDNSVDFARAYGALGWALSKVINRKDIPQIYTMFNEGFATATNNRLPLEAFSKKRDEVVQEVLRVKERHNDNIITSLEETMRQIEMVATVITAICWRVKRRLLQVRLCAVAILVAPSLILLELVSKGVLVLETWTLATVATGYVLTCIGIVSLLWEYFRQFQRLQCSSLDATFEELYAEHFIHDDGEDFRLRWCVAKPRVSNILNASPCIVALPTIHSWEIARIRDCVSKDVWYLRQLARSIRLPAK